MCSSICITWLADLTAHPILNVQASLIRTPGCPWAALYSKTHTPPYSLALAHGTLAIEQHVSGRSWRLNPDLLLANQLTIANNDF